jgi:hypothetical protein
MVLRAAILDGGPKFFYYESESLCSTNIVRKDNISETRMKGFIPDSPNRDAGNNLAKDLSLLDSKCIGCNYERSDGAFGDKK